MKQSRKNIAVAILTPRTSCCEIPTVRGQGTECYICSCYWESESTSYALPGLDCSIPCLLGTGGMSHLRGRSWQQSCVLFLVPIPGAPQLNSPLQVSLSQTVSNGSGGEQLTYKNNTSITLQQGKLNSANAVSTRFDFWMLAICF